MFLKLEKKSLQSWQHDHLLSPSPEFMDTPAAWKLLSQKARYTHLKLHGSKSSLRGAKDGLAEPAAQDDFRSEDGWTRAAALRVWSHGRHGHSSKDTLLHSGPRLSDRLEGWFTLDRSQKILEMGLLLSR